MLWALCGWVQASGVRPQCPAHGCRAQWARLPPGVTVPGRPSAGAPDREAGPAALQRRPHRDGGLRPGVGRCVHHLPLCLVTVPPRWLGPWQGLKSAHITQETHHQGRDGTALPGPGRLRSVPREGTGSGSPPLAAPVLVPGLLCLAPEPVVGLCSLQTPTCPPFPHQGPA